MPVEYLGELVGTFILILLGNGVVANVVLQRTKGNGAGWIVITFGWGMAVFVAALCVGAISGAHINPAVTLGLAAADKLPWDRVPGYLTAQMVGAIAAAILVYVLYRDHYKATSDADAKLATFCTGPAVRNLPLNLFSEVIGTFVLVFAVLMAVEPSIDLPIRAADRTDLVSTKVGLGAVGALPVGLVVFAIGMSLGGTTGYAINPARDLGPRIAHALLPIAGKRDSDWGYAWVPVAGPVIGGFLAVLVRVQLFPVSG